MGSLGTIRDAIATKITALFSGKKRIPRPRTLDQNNDNILNNGWGIYIGPSSTTDQSLGFHFSVKATDINIVLTEKIYTLDNTHVGEAAVEDSLHTDKEFIIEAIGDLQLEGIEDSLLSIVYTSDDGGQFIFGEKNNYLALTITFSIINSKNKTYCV